MASERMSGDNRSGKQTEVEGAVTPSASSWQADLLKGFLWALLIVVSLLFYTGNASHFVYVDF